MEVKSFQFESLILLNHPFVNVENRDRSDLVVRTMPENERKGFTKRLVVSLKVKISKIQFFIWKKLPGVVWSFRNKEKVQSTEAPSCHNWLQSGCPLNNNMVIHQCPTTTGDVTAVGEDIAKQDQIRGKNRSRCHKQILQYRRYAMLKLSNPIGCSKSHDYF